MRSSSFGGRSSFGGGGRGGGGRGGGGGRSSGGNNGPAIMMMPPTVRAMFMPKPPLKFIPKPKLKPLKLNKGVVADVRSTMLTGVAAFMSSFGREEDLTDKNSRSKINKDDKCEENNSVGKARVMMILSRKKQREENRVKLHKEVIAPLVEDYRTKASQCEGSYEGMNCYNTVFVGRLAYEVTERKLLREFEHYGPVKDVKLISDKEGKSRGYAFIEFEKEDDMRRAYRGADGMRIEGRQIIVDVERGHTVPNWLPRRLGGGLGGTRTGAKDDNVNVPGRWDPAMVEISRRGGPPPGMGSNNGPPPSSMQYDSYHQRHPPSRNDSRNSHRGPPPSSRYDSRGPPPLSYRGSSYDSRREGRGDYRPTEKRRRSRSRSRERGRPRW